MVLSSSMVRYWLPLPLSSSGTSSPIAFGRLSTEKYCPTQPVPHLTPPSYFGYNLPILSITTMPIKLSRAQVAQMLHITPKTLAVWEKAGRIPAPERDWRGWRLYDEAAVATIRAALGDSLPISSETVSREPMLISARNALRGIVREITGDGVLCEVTLDLGNGQEIVSVITRSSAQRLGLKPGVEATALIKSTEVLLAR